MYKHNALDKGLSAIANNETITDEHHKAILNAAANDGHKEWFTGGFRKSLAEGEIRRQAMRVAHVATHFGLNSEQLWDSIRNEESRLARVTEKDRQIDSYHERFRNNLQTRLQAQSALGSASDAKLQQVGNLNMAGLKINQRLNEMNLGKQANQMMAGQGLQRGSLLNSLQSQSNANTYNAFSQMHQSNFNLRTQAAANKINMFNKIGNTAFSISAAAFKGGAK